VQIGELLTRSRRCRLFRGDRGRPKEAGIARYGEPEEIAELMAFLVSPAARWPTGSALRADGGEVKSTQSRDGT